MDDEVKGSKQAGVMVAINVKYRLNQDNTKQFIVMTDSRITNQKEETAVVADLVETVVVADLVETVVVADLVETVVVEDLEIEDHVKCTRQHVVIVAMNVKYHSNQVEKNQSIVMTASRLINQHDDN